MAIQGFCGIEERQRLVPSLLQILQTDSGETKSHQRSLLPPKGRSPSVNRQQAPADWHRTTLVILNINKSIALYPFKGAFSGVATLNHSLQVCDQFSIAVVTLVLITHGVRLEDILSR